MNCFSIHTENLNAELEKKFRAWFSQEPKQTLIRIIQSELKVTSVEALKNAVESKQNPLQMDAANDALQKAQALQDVLNVMQRLHDQPIDKPYLVSKFV